MPSNVRSFPRVIRPAPSPLGLYIRAGRNDHKELLNFLASGDAGFTGVVFDATQHARHQELREHVLDRRLDAVLDPCTQQSALPGIFSSGHSQLPWGRQRPHEIDDFQSRAGRQLIAKVAEFTVAGGYTQILAPTHVAEGPSDPWIDVDTGCTEQLRLQLDAEGGANIPIIYSLALPYASLRNADQRRVFIETIRDLPVNAIWLKVDGLGASSTANATCNYIAAALDFAELGIPVVGDHVGGLTGLALLAFGAAGGLAHGVTLKERFNARSWRRGSTSPPFAPERRVYLRSVDLMLEPRKAETILDFSPRVKAAFACRDTACCRRGIKDMLQNPARHFLYQRSRQIQALSQIPEHLRPSRFLETEVRPVTDQAVKLANLGWGKYAALERKTMENRKRLDNLRVALGELLQRQRSRPGSVLPETRASREARL